MTAYKMMVLGEIGVGKSSLVRRLVLDRFETQYTPTIGVDVYRYEMPAEGERPRMSLVLWDTDGNFGETIFRHVYMKEASAALIVADMMRRPTVETMIRLGEGFADALPGRPIAFALNKSDLVGLQGEEGPALPPARPDIPLLRTSALTGAGVKDAFHRTAAAILRLAL